MSACAVHNQGLLQGSFQNQKAVFLMISNDFILLSQKCIDKVLHNILTGLCAWILIDRIPYLKLFSR